jgi:hypothetical protein
MVGETRPYCQLSTVNYERGRVYKIADLEHRWLVKPAPTVNCQLSTVNCQLSTLY